MFGALLLSATLFIPSGANALVRENGVGKLPALGWNSWNAFECNIDAVKIMTAANHMVNLGLKAVGYEYVNIDDCWSVKYARNASNNRIIPNPTRFPTGIIGVAEEVHALGLKIGLYSSAGEYTCAGYPASLGYEKVDAEAFAEWGIDYLKYDDCGVPPEWQDEYISCVPDSDEDPSSWNFPNGTCPDLMNPAPKGYDWTRSKTHQRYINMRDALLNVNRTILYSLCDMGHANVNTWGNSTGNSWRITNDIRPEWVRIAEIANENTFLLDYVDFWGHPDPDMLEVGNGNLTLAENRAHFALWAAMKSPLLIGTPLDTIKYHYLEILKNEYLLAFHQDPIIGRPALPYKWGYNPDWTFDPAHPAEYWSGVSTTLEATLVLMLNSEEGRSYRTAVWSEIPQLKSHDAYQVIDAWTGKSLGCVQSQYSVQLTSHDVAVLVVKGRC